VQNLKKLQLELKTNFELCKKNFENLKTNLALIMADSVVSRVLMENTQDRPSTTDNRLPLFHSRCWEWCYTDMASKALLRVTLVTSVVTYNATCRESRCPLVHRLRRWYTW